MLSGVCGVAVDQKMVGKMPGFCRGRAARSWLALLMRLLRRRQGLRHGAHAGILPDVTLVENLDGGRQRDGQQRADQAAQDKRPDQHGEHDRERMKLHGIPHDFRLDDPSVKLVDGQEDAGNDQHVLEVPPRKPGQQDRGNEGGDDAQVGHDAQHADRRADGDGVRQAEQFQADGDQDAFNDAHQHLAAEEGNQVSVDFLHGVHHVLSEFGGLQRQDAGPFLPDVILSIRKSIWINIILYNIRIL